MPDECETDAPGACCMSNGLCLLLTEQECGYVPPPAYWSGPFTECIDAGGEPHCPAGACCLPDGTCVLSLPDEDCTGAGGLFQGAGTACQQSNCPQPQGACCLSGGSCISLRRADCQQFPGGIWAGALTTCVNDGGGALCPLGACCLPNGSCTDGVLPEACSAMNGTHRPGGIACAQANCPPPLGACCLGNGTCVSVNKAECGLFSGSTWAGALSACADVGGTPTCPLGACCLPSGDCLGAVLQSSCDQQGGVFRAPGSTCANANCPQPPGACCLANGSCVVLTRTNCAASPGSRWAGPSTTCVDNNANGRADACESVPGDINGDGVATLSDIPPFIAVLLGTPQAPEHMARANLNGDGASDGGDVAFFVTAIRGAR